MSREYGRIVQRDLLQEIHTALDRAKHAEAELAATRAALIALRDDMQTYVDPPNGYLAGIVIVRIMKWAKALDALTQAAGLPDAQERP